MLCLCYCYYTTNDKENCGLGVILIDTKLLSCIISTANLRLHYFVQCSIITASVNVSTEFENMQILFSDARLFVGGHNLCSTTVECMCFPYFQVKLF